MNILFVGYRKGAYQAAASMGLSVGILTEKEIPESALKSWPPLFVKSIDFDDFSGGDMIKLVSYLRPHNFMAIVALTEKSVVVAGLLREELGLKGHGKFISERCHDKFLMKTHAKKASLPVAEFILLDERSKEDLVVEKLGLPLILKLRDSSGGRQLKVIEKSEDLSRYFRPGLIAEKFVVGKEMSVESFVQKGEILFTNITEYHLPREMNICPAPLAEEVKKKILDFNRKVLQKFQVERGMTHLELFLTDKKIILGELAVRPPGGYLMEVLDLVYGLNSWQTLLQLECGQAVSCSQEANGFGASWVIHPGEGEIQSIEGDEAIKSLPGVVDLKVKLHEGKMVSPREGAGEDTGRALFTAKTYEELIKVLQEAKRLLKIEFK